MQKKNILHFFFLVKKKCFSVNPKNNGNILIIETKKLIALLGNSI